MNETTAKTIASLLGGAAEQTGGNLWVVRWQTAEGVVVLSDDMMALYAGGRAFLDGTALREIYFA